MNKTLVTTLKFAASGLIFYVLWRKADDPLAKLRGHSIDWGLFSIALGACMAATLLSFLRWRLLVRLLDLQFSIRDSLRLGFLGYMMNFFSLGAVGGDLFKAVAVAREQPGSRAEAVASVIVDRVVGLFGLMLLASVSIAIGQTWNKEFLRTASLAVIATTMIAVFGLAAAFAPAFSGPRMHGLLQRIPKAGRHASRLLGALAMYRQKRAGLAIALAMSLGVHGLLVCSIHLTAQAMYESSPSLADQFVACPIALLTGVLPLPFSGLGALEAVLDSMYPVLFSGFAKGDGMIVGIAYRFSTIAIAFVGLAYYMAVRKEIASLSEAQVVAVE